MIIFILWYDWKKAEEKHQDETQGVTQGVCHVAVYRSVFKILTLLSVSDFGYFLTH